MKTYTKGDRVALHPATDEWIRGNRFGTVVGMGKTRDYIDLFTREIVKARPVRVKLDKSRSVKRFHPENLNLIV